jgi:1-deoxy-D-xylulose-5-phosphate reductoisomerase
MKRITILGSTGSIGKSALDCVRKAPGKFRVTGLCAYSDIRTLTAQVKEFFPSCVCIVDAASAEKFKSSCNKKIKVFKGREGLLEFSARESDISLMAIAGISALEPLLITMRHTKRVALANKESVVCAGSFVFNAAKAAQTEILPVDSEINALYQLLNLHDAPSSNGNRFQRVYLTASGGALFDYLRKELSNVTVKDVLAHPTWSMGARITVDCATLVNKGFEVIETHNFFNLAYDDIGIIIHRESKIHALAEFKDKTILACVYPADMRIPITFALHYPQRATYPSGLDFSKAFSLTFQPLNLAQFPLLEMILCAARKDDNSLVILNACDEMAIEYFLKKKIRFTDIYKTMNYVFTHYPSKRLTSVKDVFYWNTWARQKTEEYLQTLC